MAGRRGRGGHGGGGGHASSERWLLTYADLITLLLVFFVVMYSMSQVNQKKYDQLKKSLAASMTVIGKGGNDPTIIEGGQGVLPQAETIIAPEQLELERIARDVKAMAKEAGLEGQVETTMDKQGLVVSISNAGFFEPGEATLRGDVIPALDRIARMIKASDHDLRIEGHTDNIPISTPKYPSNWELSAVRATTIVRFLVERHSFVPRRLSAAGYGEYYPKVPNDTEVHRAQNRRVDIVVLRSTQVQAPPTSGVNVSR